MEDKRTPTLKVVANTMPAKSQAYTQNDTQKARAIAEILDEEYSKSTSVDLANLIRREINCY